MVIFPFLQFKQYVQFLKSLPDYNATRYKKRRDVIASDYKLGSFQVTRFPNQELYIKLPTNVAHKDCLIIGSITPPDEQLISFLFLAHTLKKELASKITALIPYLAYARQDKIKKGESLATSTIGEIFRASHIDEVVTIDVHSKKAENLFPLPIHNLSPAKLFAKEIKKLGLKNPTFVSPDEGAIERTQAVLDALNIKTDISYMRKIRTQVEVISTLYGHVGHDVVVVDDILDTGETLLACCEILKCAGAKNIYIFVTHGLFTGNEWQDLFNLNVKKIYCTDSIPQIYSLKVKNLEILSVKPLFREYAGHIRKIQEEVKRTMRRIKRREQDFSWERRLVNEKLGYAKRQ